MVKYIIMLMILITNFSECQIGDDFNKFKKYVSSKKFESADEIIDNMILEKKNVDLFFEYYIESLNVFKSQINLPKRKSVSKGKGFITLRFGVIREEYSLKQLDLLRMYISKNKKGKLLKKYKLHLMMSLPINNTKEILVLSSQLLNENDSYLRKQGLYYSFIVALYKNDFAKAVKYIQKLLKHVKINEKAKYHLYNTYLLYRLNETITAKENLDKIISNQKYPVPIRKIAKIWKTKFNYSAGQKLICIE